MDKQPADILPAIAPELADADTETHIELAEGQTGDVYGDQRPYAVALLAAHMLTLANREGASGALESRKEGGLSVSFGAGSGTALGSTSYGAELERLRASLIMGARTVAV